MDACDDSTDSNQLGSLLINPESQPFLIMLLLLSKYGSKNVFCSKTDTVCGSDGRTYLSHCDVKIALEQDYRLHIVKFSPCHEDIFYFYCPKVVGLNKGVSSNYPLEYKITKKFVELFTKKPQFDVNKKHRESRPLYFPKAKEERLETDTVNKYGVLQNYPGSVIAGYNYGINEDSSEGLSKLKLTKANVDLGEDSQGSDQTYNLYKLKKYVKPKESNKNNNKSNFQKKTSDGLFADLFSKELNKLDSNSDSDINKLVDDYSTKELTNMFVWENSKEPNVKQTTEAKDRSPGWSPIPIANIKNPYLTSGKTVNFKIKNGQNASFFKNINTYSQQKGKPFKYAADFPQGLSVNNNPPEESEDNFKGDEKVKNQKTGVKIKHEKYLSKDSKGESEENFLGVSNSKSTPKPRDTDLQDYKISSATNFGNKVDGSKKSKVINRPYWRPKYGGADIDGHVVPNSYVNTGIPKLTEYMTSSVVEPIHHNEIHRPWVTEKRKTYQSTPVTLIVYSMGNLDKNYNVFKKNTSNVEYGTLGSKLKVNKDLWNDEPKSFDNMKSQEYQIINGKKFVENKHECDPLKPWWIPPFCEQPRTKIERKQDLITDSKDVKKETASDDEIEKYY